MRALLLLGLGASLVACSNSRRDTNGPRDAGVTADAMRIDASRSDGGGGDAGGNSDAGLPDDLEYNPDGCLTFAGANRLCGFGSDGAICAFSLECGFSESTSQCGINCEMGSTVRCYTRTNVACLRSAIADSDCGALEACGFIL